jgi:hypothetical protein
MNFDKLVNQLLKENQENSEPWDPYKHLYAQHRAGGNITGADMQLLINHVKTIDDVKAGRINDVAGRNPEEIKPIPDDIREIAKGYENDPKLKEHQDKMAGYDRQIEYDKAMRRARYIRRNS